MLLAYIDETHAGGGEGNYYVVGVVVQPEQARDLAPALSALVRDAAREYGVPANAELHGHELMKGSSDWEALKGKTRARIAIYNKALDVISDRIDGFYVRGVNRDRLSMRYRAPFDPHDVATKFLLEELHEHCVPQGELILCIADEHSRQQAVRDELQRCRDGAGWGFKEGGLANILDTCHFVPSHHSRLVQATDMIAYMYRRQKDHTETDKRAAEAKAKMWARIEHKLIRDRVWHP